MGQKVHPLGFRLGVTENHRAHWFATPSQYSFFLQEDDFIRNYLKSNLKKQAGILRLDLKRKANRIIIQITANQISYIVGRNRKGAEKLRQDLENKLKKQYYSTATKHPTISIYGIKNKNLNSKLIAESIVEKLEKRTPFRKAIRFAVRDAHRAGVKGLKIQVSGRLNGAEIARSEWVRDGQVPLQTLRANIDYCYETAQTIYGILGIKVWLYK